MATTAWRRMVTPPPSAKKAYDGKALTKSDGAELFGFVSKETATLNVTGYQTKVGMCGNTCEIVWDGTAKEQNYALIEKLGTLEVTETPVKAKATTASMRRPRRA